MSKLKISVIVILALYVPGINAYMPPQGFIGLNFELMHSGASALLTRDSTEQSLNDAMPKLAVSVDGSSENFDITTSLTLFSDLLNISEYYSSLPVAGYDSIYSFSYTDFSVEYSTYASEQFLVAAGFGLGHRGYLYQGFDAIPWHIYLSGNLSGYWFFSSHLMLHAGVALPVAVIKNRVQRSFFVNAETSIYYDPRGTMRNPVPDTFFLRLGLRYRHDNFTYTDASDTKVVLNTLEPYISYVLLY